MSAMYEIGLDASLGHFIRNRVEQFFTREKYDKILEISTPDGPDILEFKHGKQLISVSFMEYRAGHIELVMESEAAGADALFIRAAHWIASDLLANVIRGLPGCRTDILDGQIERCLDDLFARVSDCPVTSESTETVDEHELSH